jgi:hypothetical protein
VGGLVGSSVGFNDGDLLGKVVGLFVSTIVVGKFVGGLEGWGVGCNVGDLLGKFVGLFVSKTVVGVCVIWWEGKTVGVFVVAVGAKVDGASTGAAVRQLRIGTPNDPDCLL